MCRHLVVFLSKLIKFAKTGVIKRLLPFFMYMDVLYVVGAGTAMYRMCGQG